MARDEDCAVCTLLPHGACDYHEHLDRGPEEGEAMRDFMAYGYDPPWLVDRDEAD